jgi:hypothetical protein
MNTLNNENIIYVPNTLDGENIVSSHLEENALLVDGTNQMLANLNAGNHRLTHVSSAISSNDAVNKGQLDLKADTTYVELNLKADTTYVDGNFLNKVTSSSQFVAGRLSFNNATSGSSFPIIQLTNAITGSNNGMYLQFFKNFNRVPNTEIGSIVFADKAVSSQATSRAVQITASIDNTTNPLLNITFDSGDFNPLTISNTQTILRNNDFYIRNKTTSEILLTYLNASDKFTMYKPLDMNNTNKISNLAEPTLAQDAATKYYTDTHSNNQNYLLRDGTLPMTGNLQMGSFNITNLLDPADLNDGANKYYVDTQTANTHYLLRNGSLAMTGNLNLATHDLITTGTIDCNDITADGDITTTSNMSCADFNSAGNQVIGGSSLNVLDVKSSAFFESNVLIESNKQLAFNSDDLSSAKGMFMSYNGSVGFLDFRGNEFRVRTSSTGTPDTIRFKINDTNTSVINNFFVNGNSTLGDNVATDTTTFNSIANFPSGSELKFNSGSTLLLQSGASTTFASGSYTYIEDGANLQFKSNSSSYYLAGAWLEYACVQSFLPTSYIDSARVRLIPSGNSNIQLSNLSVENGMYCNNTSKITITMPNKNVYWNNRHYIIKILVEDVDFATPTGVSIDNNTNTIGVSTNYRSYQFAFTSDFSTTGKIYIIGDK